MSLTHPLQGVQYTSAEQIEDVVRQLKDVISARAVLGTNGSMQELHVMTSSKRAPKLVARDIESALSAHLGMTVDYKKISIAQTRFSRPVDRQLRPRDSAFPALRILAAPGFSSAMSRSVFKDCARKRL